LTYIFLKGVFNLTEETIKTASSSKLELLKIVIEITIAIILFFSPLLYLIGIAFHEGYASAYGISTGFFPLSSLELKEYIYFLYIEKVIIKFLCDIFCYVVICVLVIPIFLSILSSLKKQFSSYNFFQEIDSFLDKRWFPPIKKWPKLAEFFQNIESNVKWLIGNKFFLFLISILLVSIIFGYFVYLAGKEGKEYANTHRKDYLEKGCFFKEDGIWSNCDSLVNQKGEILHTGLLIATSNNYIAFFNCEGSIVTKFPNDAVIRNEIKKIDGKGKKKSNNPFPYCQNVPVTSTSKTQ
jgi:hypothetical protein